MMSMVTVGVVEKITLFCSSSSAQLLMNKRKSDTDFDIFVASAMQRIFVRKINHRINEN